jgi:hypothetical protein
MILGFYYLTIEKPPIATPQSIFNSGGGEKSDAVCQPGPRDRVASPRLRHTTSRLRDAVTFGVTKRLRHQEQESESILPNSDSGQANLSHSRLDLGFLSALNGFNSVIQAYEQKKLSLHSFVWVKPDSGTGSGSEASFPSSISSNFQELGQEMGTGDSFFTTKKRKLTKHFQDSNTLPGGYTFTQPPPYRKIKQAFSGNSELSKNLMDEKLFYLKPNARGGNPDEPLGIRLIQTGQAKKLYTSSQWIESTQGTRRFIQIRTTPGRILVNQLLSVFLGPV